MSELAIHSQEKSLCIQELKIIEALESGGVRDIARMVPMETIAPRGMVDLFEQQVLSAVQLVELFGHNPVQYTTR